MLLDYGYRSRCCYAPIRIGFKRLKNTTSKKKVWVCVRCKKSDVAIIEYTKEGLSGTTPKIKVKHQFASDDEPEIQDSEDEVEVP